MTGETVLVSCAGRTDAGVHAEGQVASFDLDSRIPPAACCAASTPTCPRTWLVEVGRGGARLRRALLGARQGLPLPVWNHSCARRGGRAPHGTCAGAVDTDAMRRAAAALVGEHDFRAFRASRLRPPHDGPDRPPPATSTGRAPVLTFEVEATAFLKNMVRIVVGTLVDVGRGRMPEDAASRTCWRPATAPPAA